MSKTNPHWKDPEKATDKEKDIWREEKGSNAPPESIDKRYGIDDVDPNAAHGKGGVIPKHRRDKGHGIGDVVKHDGGALGKPADRSSTSKTI
jgi:hypothetical protein